MPLRVLLIEDLKQVLNNGETHFLLVEDGTVQGSKIGSRMYKIYVEPLGNFSKTHPVLIMDMLMTRVPGK